MKGGKRVIGVIVVGLLLIVCLSLSALDFGSNLFGGDDKDLEGELNTGAQANIRIAAPTAAPNITYISPVFNTNIPAGRDLNPGTTTDFKFNFTVKQGIAGSIAYLPGAGQNEQGKLELIILKLENNPRTLTGDCTWVADLPDGTGRNYTCIIPMEFYDASTLPNWTLILQLSDINNLWSIPVNNSRHFAVNSLSAFDRTPIYINWTNPPVQTLALNTEANNVLTISNTGNQNIVKGSSPELRILTTDVIGDGTPPGNITASNFSANDLGAGSYCGVAYKFTHDVYTSLTFTLNRQTSGSSPTTDSLGFCILRVPDVVAQNFSSTGWDLTLA